MQDNPLANISYHLFITKSIHFMKIFQQISHILLIHHVFFGKNVSHVTSIMLFKLMLYSPPDKNFNLILI